jgi:hypothetical protein
VIAYHADIIAIEQNFRQLDLRTGKVTASNQVMIFARLAWSYNSVTSSSTISDMVSE